jgi:serine/threonine protein kinase
MPLARPPSVQHALTTRFARVQRRTSPASNGVSRPRPIATAHVIHAQRRTSSTPNRTSRPRPKARAIHAQRRASLSPNVRAQRRVVVAHCHVRGVFHRNLKPENVLLGGDGRLLVAHSDFGLATEEDWCATRAGTPAYILPGGFPSTPRADRTLMRTAENYARGAGTPRARRTSGRSPCCSSTSFRPGGLGPCRAGPRTHSSSRTPRRPRPRPRARAPAVMFKCLRSPAISCVAMCMVSNISLNKLVLSVMNAFHDKREPQGVW